MRFSDEENKYIAEFFVRHYAQLSGRQQSAEINRVRNELYKKLTNELNGIFGKSYSREQVHDKVKNLKSGSKRKYAEEKSESRATGGGQQREVRTSTAEDLIIGHLQNTPGFDGMPNILDTARQQPVTISSEISATSKRRITQAEISSVGRSNSERKAADHSEVAGMEAFDTGSPAWNDSYVQQESYSPEAPHQVTTCGQRSTSPGGAASGSSTHKKRHRSVSSSSGDTSACATNKRSKKVSAKSKVVDDARIVADVQQKVCRAQLAILEKKAKLYKERKVIMEKKLAAIDEFRSAVSEFRMQMRGIDVSTVPMTVAADLADKLLGNRNGL